MANPTASMAGMFPMAKMDAHEEHNAMPNDASNIFTQTPRTLEPVNMLIKISLNTHSGNMVKEKGKRCG